MPSFLSSVMFAATVLVSDDSVSHSARPKRNELLRQSLSREIRLRNPRKRQPELKWMGEWEEAESEPVFLHVPKNGGTAIKKVARMPAQGKRHKRATGCTHYHMPPQWLPHFGAYPRVTGTDKTNTFMIARDPFAKIISEWRYVLYLGSCPKPLLREIVFLYYSRFQTDEEVQLNERQSSTH